MNKKIRIQPLLDSDVHKKLTDMAKENGAKVSPYAASVLTKHVNKQETKHYSKREVKPNIKK